LTLLGGDGNVGWCLPALLAQTGYIMPCLSLPILTAIFQVSWCLLKQRMMVVVVKTGAI